MESYLPYILPLCLIALFWFRYRGGREVKVNNWRLAGSVFVISSLIAIVFATEPHEHLDARHFSMLLVSAIAGLVTGVARARAFQLRRLDDAVLMKTSSSAFFFLVCLIFVRGVARQKFGNHSALALDASMLFALFMVISQRVTIWNRARNLLC